MIKKSKLPQAIDPCVRVFEFFCFADVPRRASAREKLAAMWIVMKYLVMLGILGFNFVDSILRRINRLHDSHGNLVHVINFVSSSTLSLTLIQALVSSSKSLKFMRRMVKVDEIFVNSLSLPTNYNNLRWTLLVTIIFNILFYFAAIGGKICLSLQFQPHLGLLPVTYQIPKMLGSIFTLRFTFMVQLLTFYLNLMVDALEKSISNQPLLVRKEEKNKWNMKSNHLKVRMLQKAYRWLWEASVMINESVHVGLFDVFLVQCLSLIYQGYNLCVDLSMKKEFHHRQVLSALFSLFELYSVHYYCQQCLNSVIP